MSVESKQTNQGVFADARRPVSTRTFRTEGEEDVGATGRSPLAQYSGR
jgi:hypothetical protein